MKLTRTILSLFIIILLLFTGGCSKEDSQLNSSYEEETDTSYNSGIALNMQSVEPLNLQLESYNGSFFTMNIPKGWIMETAGEYENFGFRLYDPSQPSRQIFYYGNMSPFLKSNEAKSAWETYITYGGYSSAQLYADAPVLTSPTTQQFFYTFEQFAALANQYGISHNFPTFANMEIIESTPRNSSMSSVALDDSINRVLFTNNGVPCEGLLAGSVVDAMSSYMYGVDAGYYTVYAITGITAPADEFYLIQDTLSESLASFQFADYYIQAGVNQNNMETNAALQVAQTLSEAYDSYNQAWSSRQVVNDTLSQKRSDATLGYDRLYDTQTGDVYRAELGFYETYKANRDEYSNPNLEIVPDNAYDLYNKQISAYISNYK